MAKPTSDPKLKPGKVVALDERRLLVRHQQGDAEAFPQLVAQYRRPVYGYLVRCGIESTARDDLFQEVFLKIHAAAASYQPDRPLKPWIFTVVANTVRSHYRKLRVRQLVFLDGGTSDPPAPTPSGEATALAHETAIWMQQALEDLPFTQREVVALCCIESMEQKDVAKVLDMPVATVKTHLHRARAALARKLARRNAQSHREVSS